MIAATGSVAPTLHGWLGYSALALMAVDVRLVWRHWQRNGDAPLPAGQHLFARIAYLYWIVAYFAGAALVMAAKHAQP
jgi:cytochrome b561